MFSKTDALPSKAIEAALVITAVMRADQF